MVKVSLDRVQLVEVERETFLVFLFPVEAIGGLMTLTHDDADRHQKVISRETSGVVLPEGAIGFQFYDKLRIEIIVEGRHINAIIPDEEIRTGNGDYCADKDFRDASNISPMFFPGGEFVGWEALPPEIQQYFEHEKEATFVKTRLQTYWRASNRDDPVFDPVFCTGVEVL